MSLAAIQMAAGGLPDDATLVAHWLYRFGTVPCGPALARAFGPDDDPMGVLGLTIGGRVRRVLESGYEAASLAGWYSFARAGTPVHLAAACKLYVSPRPEALADAFPRIVDDLVSLDVRSFKVGRGIEGLLRPDKIVAYFDDRAHLEAAVRILDGSLSGFPAQGVPFTAEEGGHGMLSSGVDPPRGQAATSWRAWVTQRLAASLTARTTHDSGDRAARAVADIRRAGVDERWRPSDTTFGGDHP